MNINADNALHQVSRKCHFDFQMTIEILKFRYNPLGLVITNQNQLPDLWGDKENHKFSETACVTVQA